MRGILDHMASVPWAMPAADLRLLITMASRSRLDRATAREGEGETWHKPDFGVMAGAGATRLAGAQRAYAVDGVAVIPLTGPIFPRANMMTEMSGATSISMLQNDYRVALNSPAVGAILFVVDSPGGAVSGISGFVDTVAAGRRRKPTSAFVSGTAASAAYWIASAADEVILERTALVGSIGVVLAMSKQVEPNADGEMLVEIVSSNAPNKRPDPTSEGGVGVVTSLLNSLETKFIADVARGRGTTPARVKSDFGAGSMRVGEEAVRVGMADRIMTYDAAMFHMVRTAKNAARAQKLGQGQRALESRAAVDRLAPHAEAQRPGETMEAYTRRRVAALRR